MSPNIDSTQGRLWTLNPFTEVSLLSSQQGEALVVLACRRGHSLACGLVESDREPALFEALLPLARRSVQDRELGPPPVAGKTRRWRAPRALVSRARELGLIVPREQQPRPVAFDWGLTPAVREQLPDGLREEPATETELIFHPGVRWASASPQPELEAVFGRSPSTTTVLVTDPGTRALVPVELGRYAPAVRALHAGGSPRSLTRATRRALVSLGLLVTPAALARRRALWSELGSGARARLHERGYSIVEGLLGPVQVAQLRAYYQRYIEEGFMAFRAVEGQRALVARDEPIARFYQERLAPMMSRITGERVVPSWLVVTAYRPGAICPRHVDQPDSHWNLSLQIDFTPEPRKVARWPLYLESADGGLAGVNLALGDGVFYSGSRTPHFRKRLNGDRSSLVIVFHYKRR